MTQGLSASRLCWSKAWGSKKYGNELGEGGSVTCKELRWASFKNGEVVYEATVELDQRKCAFFSCPTHMGAALTVHVVCLKIAAPPEGGSRGLNTSLFLAASLTLAAGPSPRLDRLRPRAAGRFTEPQEL